MRKKLLLAMFCVLVVWGVAGARAENTPGIAVRTGVHETYDRVVFDWPLLIKYSLKQDGTHVSLVFEAPGNIKLVQSEFRHLTRAHDFSLHVDDKGQGTVSFTVGDGAAIKTFVSGKSIVVDVGDKKTDTPNAPAASPTAPVTGAPLTTPPSPTTQTTPAQTQPPESTVAPRVGTAPPASSSTSSVALPHSKRTGNQMPLSDTPMLMATLDPHIPTRIVVYERAEVGYIVFDHKLTLTAAALENGIPAQINLQPIDIPNYSGFSFPVPINSELKATLDGTVWKIFLAKKQMAVPVTTALVPQPDFALGARYLLPLPDAPEPIHFIDPVVGDNLVLVPLGQSEAFNAFRRMSDFWVLPAAQGLVIKPLIDKLIVRAVSDGIEITAEGGLTLSRGADTGTSQQSASRAKAAAQGKSIFDFSTWAGKPGETFTEARQRLQQTIVDVPEADRNRARLELARFYFARGDGEEALALLDMLATQVPDLRAHSDFMALVGSAEILAYRPQDGLRDLSGAGLVDQPEVELWQAVAYAQLRDWQHAEEKFAVREVILAGYPEPFFSRFFVLAIESALAAGKEHEAADWLDFISNAQHSASIDPALDYLHGALDAKAGRAEAAEGAWKSAESTNDQLYKVRAELALIDLGVSNGSLTPAQAADRLEALRFAWRGDDLEVDILHRLGQFYIQAKNVKNGLNAMSQAVTLYPNSPMAPAIRAEMAKTFYDVFIGDLGKKLSPLDSLTLYQQYRDLMPSGKDGDAIMQNLAERLVAVDLLDQASSILDDLIKNRLQGEDKDRAILRISGIRLLDHKPNDAIAELDLLGNDTLNASMQSDRTILRARALSEMNRYDDAKALLKDDNSQTAKMLRADIAMHAQQWTDAAKALMDLVGPPPGVTGKLTPDQAGWLLNAAIAYALTDDQTGLDKLAIDYGAAMKPMPQNDTFQMLTEPEKTGQMRDLSAAQAQISQVDMFQDFLNQYRQSSQPDTTEKKP